MATILSHALAASTLGAIVPLPGVIKDRRFYAWTSVCAMLPDADVVGFSFGIRYEDFWGHRGFTHSLVFAAGMAALVTLCLGHRFWRLPGLRLWLFLTMAGFSHGLLDAFTNGGLGIALFSPFYNERLFFPVTPIEVSPIGRAFFSPAGLKVLLSEMLWIWLPCLWLWGLVVMIRSIGPGAKGPTAGA